MIHFHPAADQPRTDRHLGRSGLTLVELMIVIAIISVTTAIALPVTRGLIENSRVTESVRTVRSFLENARARAMSTGREHGVAFLRSAPAGNITQQGTVRTLSLVSASPSYRGDVEGAKCWVFHQSTYTTAAVGASGTIAAGTPAPAGALAGFANVAVFDPVQCPTLSRTVTVLSDTTPPVPVPPIQFGDYLVLGGQRFPIVAFSNCTGTESPLSGMTIDPSEWIKIYFDPRGDTGEVSPGFGAVMNVAEPPRISTHQQLNFEILRTRLRGSGTRLELPRGAAVDMFFSGTGTSGSEFSPLSIWDTDPTVFGTTTDLLPVIVVFDASGQVSRVLLGTRVGSTVVPISALPQGTIHFLVGRSDQILPSLPAVLASTDEDELSNIMDPESSWVSINPMNGRITNSEALGPRGVPTTIAGRIFEARRPAVLVREDNQ